MKVGIDAIAFHGPAHYVDLAELAGARNVDPAKYIYGLGQKKMAIATPCEDCVTLATNAGLKALRSFDVDPKEIGTLVVGTETGVDHSKPVAVYVHKALGLRRNCRTYETKHACFGAMAGLSAACDWIASKRARSSKALVIAADIARYPLNDPGEPTQGAGAVAMVVSKNPRLISMDPTITGDYTKEVMDFWRPLYSKVAFVDGHYSIDCYLDALEGAIQDAMSKIDIQSSFSIRKLDASFYHVPFVKMAKKAHHRHWEVLLNKTISPEDTDSQMIEASYEKRVFPWLSLNEVVGNIYTGSLFLALMDYLRRKEAPINAPISLFSYGSGCAASFSIAYLSPGFEQFKARIDPEVELNARTKITIDEYEDIMSSHVGADSNQEDGLDPNRWNLDGDFLFLGTRNHKRIYSGMP